MHLVIIPHPVPSSELLMDYLVTDSSDVILARFADAGFNSDEVVTLLAS